MRWEGCCVSGAGGQVSPPSRNLKCKFQHLEPNLESDSMAFLSLENVSYCPGSSWAGWFGIVSWSCGKEAVQVKILAFFSMGLFPLLGRCFLGWAGAANSFLGGGFSPFRFLVFSGL